MRRTTILLLSTVLLFGLAGCNSKGSTGSTGPQGDQGPQGPPGPGLDPTTAVEACIGCHGPMGVKPVGDVHGPLCLQDPQDPPEGADVHCTDDDPNGPKIGPDGYRKLNVAVSLVDVTGSMATGVRIRFRATDEGGNAIDDLFASDGALTIVRLDQGMNGDPNVWVPLLTRVRGGQTQANSESFDDGAFTPMGNGVYEYASSDPATLVVTDGDVMRLGVQIFAEDLPTGNGWCDFVADTANANDCAHPETDPAKTRDIVQTATCNGCHGVTPEVHLSLHGGRRTQVQFCVTCHNPTTIATDPDGNPVPVDFPVLIHKIHYGSSLANGFVVQGFRSPTDFSNVTFTKDIDDCTVCHKPGIALNANNWFEKPSMAACGACHDDVWFGDPNNPPPDKPKLHSGNQQTSNAFCTNCHNDTTDPVTDQQAPIQSVHLGVKRRMEGARYRGGNPPNGYVINNLMMASGNLVIDWQVRRDGAAMDVQNAPEWNAGGASRLHFSIGWNTADPTNDYTNVGSGSPPSAALDVNALDFTNVTTALGGNQFESTVALPSDAAGTIAVGMEGHPGVDLQGTPPSKPAVVDNIAVKSVVRFLNIDNRQGAVMVTRRDAVDVDNCNKCHDSSGAGISLHGENRTGTIQICAICHNPNDTDIGVRPVDPAMAVDGKKEAPIDLKRMIHMIHSGSELANGLVVYGFRPPPMYPYSVHDFSTVEFIGNRMNCETCHLPGNDTTDSPYGTFAAFDRLPTTVDTGPTSTPARDAGGALLQPGPDDNPDDDLNISPTASVCSSCHDDDTAINHMKLNGASFKALDDDIL